jgi:hypothetical protein
MGLEWKQVHCYCGHLLGYCYQPWMIDGDDCGAVGGMNEWQGKPKYSEVNCPRAQRSRMTWPGSPWWVAGDWPSELQHSPVNMIAPTEWFRPNDTRHFILSFVLCPVRVCFATGLGALQWARQQINNGTKFNYCKFLMKRVQSQGNFWCNLMNNTGNGNKAGGWEGRGLRESQESQHSSQASAGGTPQPFASHHKSIVTGSGSGTNNIGMDCQTASVV